jgi:hypothetical protein
MHVEYYGKKNNNNKARMHAEKKEKAMAGACMLHCMQNKERQASKNNGRPMLISGAG